MNFGTAIPVRHYTGFRNAWRRIRRCLDLIHRQPNALSADMVEELRTPGYMGSKIQG